METDASLAPARPLPAERPGGPAPGTTGVTAAVSLELCLTGSFWMLSLLTLRSSFWFLSVISGVSPCPSPPPLFSLQTLFPRRPGDGVRGSRRPQSTRWSRPAGTSIPGDGGGAWGRPLGDKHTGRGWRRDTPPGRFRSVLALPT